MLSRLFERKIVTIDSYYFVFTAKGYKLSFVCRLKFFSYAFRCVEDIATKKRSNQNLCQTV